MSIGIIGGPDGPTQVYVSQANIWEIIIDVAMVIIVIIIIAIIFLKRN